ncbi:hypothetical protein TYRP_009540 [Tyrophagus putrescentiae]|nr:hypothetical protein TYRP_009540 [Tyrophagus putrescentiae]
MEVSKVTAAPDELVPTATSSNNSTSCTVPDTTATTTTTEPSPQKRTPAIINDGDDGEEEDEDEEMEINDRVALPDFANALPKVPPTAAADDAEKEGGNVEADELSGDDGVDGDGARQVPPTAAADDEGEENQSMPGPLANGQYEVEDIISQRRNSETDEIEYEVKWVGY